ncbi:unnamed protein product [Prorocentrum cordatum]|uniref:Chromo domain-containing protein n=1 Tax=Prorocentrum cordatum TaxID=2364126 RepID=A0ABN9T8J5_9DINO|nr:unnamed protein product [Polarella glacialis]
MTLLCSEASPSEDPNGVTGEVWRHCNLRMSYMKQEPDHLKALGPFFSTSPFVYITDRFKNGYDGDLQKRLMEPEDEEEAGRRALLAKEHGKYGNQVAELVSRTKMGSTLAYEVRWEGLDDPKQNTVESITKLKAMGLDKVVIACDERIAAKAAGLDQRPLTRREVVRHVEAFGIDEDRDVLQPADQRLLRGPEGAAVAGLYVLDEAAPNRGRRADQLSRRGDRRGARQGAHDVPRRYFDDRAQD